MERSKANQDSVRCWMCGAVGSRLDEFTSPSTGMCATCSPRDGVTIPPMLVAAGVTQEELDAVADSVDGNSGPTIGPALAECDKAESYLLGFDNVPRQSAWCRGCGVVGPCVDPPSPYAGLCKTCVKAKAIQPVRDAEGARRDGGPVSSVDPPAVPLPRTGAVCQEPIEDNGAPHSWRIVGFEPRFRRECDSRLAEEAGTLVWACSLCGSIVRSIASQPPAHHAKNCILPLPQPLPRQWLSERFRSMAGDREISADKSQRLDKLLFWMDLYQEDGVPVPPHWVSEALEIMAEGR